MTIIIMENVPPSLRGELTKWMIEIKAGVFIAKLNALVRKLLWQKCEQNKGDGSLIMVWATNTEQGFDIKHKDVKDYIPIDFEGIYLTLHPK